MLMRSDKMARTLALMLPLFLATGCATTTGSGAEAVKASRSTVAMCDVFKPIRWSVKDTDDTIAAVKEHNAVWTVLCSK